MKIDKQAAITIAKHATDTAIKTARLSGRTSKRNTIGGG